MTRPKSLVTSTIKVSKSCHPKKWWKVRQFYVHQRQSVGIGKQHQHKQSKKCQWRATKGWKLRLFPLLVSHLELTMDAKEDEKGDYTLINDLEKVEAQLGRFDKPLPCCGCGIGWFCFLAGFLCPLTWYFALFLYLFKYYNKDPRERGGLAANAVTAVIFTVALIIGFALFMFL